MKIRFAFSHYVLAQKLFFPFSPSPQRTYFSIFYYFVRHPTRPPFIPLRRATMRHIMNNIFLLFVRRCKNTLGKKYK